MRPFGRRRARDLRKLHVVTDGDGELAKIRFEYLQFGTRRDQPLLALEPRHVQLSLYARGARWSVDETFVKDLAVCLQYGHCSGDDVHMKAARQDAHFLVHLCCLAR